MKVVMKILTIMVLVMVCYYVYNMIIQDNESYEDILKEEENIIIKEVMLGKNSKIYDNSSIKTIMLKDVDERKIKSYKDKEKETIQEIGASLKVFNDEYNRLLSDTSTDNHENIDELEAIRATTDVQYESESDVISVAVTYKYPTEMGDATKRLVLNYDESLEKMLTNEEVIVGMGYNVDDIAEQICEEFHNYRYVESSMDRDTHKLFKDIYNKEEYMKKVLSKLNEYTMYTDDKSLKICYSLSDVFDTFNVEYGIGGIFPLEELTLGE